MSLSDRQDTAMKRIIADYNFITKNVTATFSCTVPLFIVTKNVLHEEKMR